MPLTVLAADQATYAERIYIFSLKMALKSSAPVQIQPGNQSIALSCYVCFTFPSVANLSPLSSPLLFTKQTPTDGCLTIYLTPTTSQTAATAHFALITTIKAAATPARASNYSPTQTQLPYQVRQTI